MWLGLTTTQRQTWLSSSTSTYHSTDLLTACGVTHLVIRGTSGSTSYETTSPVRLESSGGALSTVDMVVQRRDGPRRLRDHDDDVHVVVAAAIITSCYSNRSRRPYRRRPPHRLISRLRQVAPPCESLSYGPITIAIPRSVL